MGCGIALLDITTVLYPLSRLSNTIIVHNQLSEITLFTNYSEMRRLFSSLFFTWSKILKPNTLVALSPVYNGFKCAKECPILCLLYIQNPLLNQLSTWNWTNCSLSQFQIHYSPKLTLVSNFGEAPLSTNSLTTIRYPALAAKCSAVQPFCKNIEMNCYYIWQMLSVLIGQIWIRQTWVK